MIKFSNAMALHTVIVSQATFVSLQYDLNTLNVKTKKVLRNMASILEELRTHTLTTAVFECTATRMSMYEYAPEETYIGECIECGKQVALLDPHGYCSAPVSTDFKVSRGGVGCFHLCCAEHIGYRLKVKMAKRVTSHRVEESNRYPAQGMHHTICSCVMCGQQVSQYDDYRWSHNH